MKKTCHGQVRIIAGHWRGRKISFLDREGLRPTPDRVRETLFNWLQADISGAKCLDLFAGSGALGFEAASRGAESVTMLDRDVETVTMLKKNAQLLQAETVQISGDDAIQYLRSNGQKFDVVFIDPPYQADLVVPCCELLEQQHCLSNHAKIYLEYDVLDELKGLPENWHCEKNKKAGQVAYQLYSRTEG
jgi:16S rRNA (guanine966-N2)-methyltransferase